ncbi:MAG: thiamine-phosphate diphosphorylase [Candidatus Raymondbacteria bacterium RifOxyA12_full_50_37]|uniref:Thiamine-phosphate synthase n=1 Tax=Candidatus Raymondbacteria bacterium RIFOXYD12_FULL_49_13 TaxID=1817890 RepID=A0A1F7F8Y2_UNCRA|nr:MAG: thiamine-phosphate diphosphorylase [Candidatus Raymondbacteria bacterium RifOxyA12_full_50_37]OGJ85413.1 MAG: thiamine-phosphate diphosphorylase [Candidatus Raymondbacteria bacterium RIFOXYA2_FULL_49_16]OGJ86137.1 MAG: thiamine-phosphate diphosphorylase [Candidatus Raymondbacteria bacterium RifOxyB12_full_50_8]OGJ94921.1 MAG: thiamine-phosphate diphosphorylase [Candidatus Raymondbacteria bacterium RIFOXYC2_FULL_50_21]OGJ98679.1 MAG: thiamine-phosphate diphosphorylase [Candidatus Raymond
MACLKVPDCFGFYGILTNPVRGYAYLAQVMVDLEVPFIQLRMKDASLDEVERTAEEIRKITAGTKSLFIVNDHPEIARNVDADGVHLGQGDMAFPEALAIVGHGKIIGLSTHTPAQTEAACRLGPSYVGIGPVYPTPTKKNPDPAIGIEGMRKMLSLTTVPAVVLGAIDRNNLADVLQAGARNFCSVRLVNSSEEPEEVIRDLVGNCSGPDVP